MNPEMEQGLNVAFAKLLTRQHNVLEVSAAQAYVTGEIAAHKTLRMGISFDLVHKEALEYGREYGKLLREKGATIINGKEVAWLAENHKTERKTIAKIISDGIAEGKPTGVLEGKRGGYPKGTIAADLHEFFHARKSHAAMVARTEVARVQNIGTLNRYEESGFTHVQVLDGGGPNSCEICEAINGQIWTIEEAASRELEHPNCYRAFVPIMN